MFGFLDRIESGWDMAVESLNVLWKDKELLAFPAISLTSCLLVLGSFAWPIWSTGYGQWFVDQPDWQRNWLLWATLFVFYTVNYFIILFFNSALVACALIRFRGGDPTLADGFRAAMQRLPQIAGWALVSATVGVILKMMEKGAERWTEKFAVNLAEFAWSMATFFVVPVLVVEKAGPLDALKRSSKVIRDAWGESFVADLGIGLVGMLFSIPAYILIFLGWMSLHGDHHAQGIAFFAGGVLWLIAVALVTSVLEMIARAGLYLQAVDEKLLRRFEKRVLGEAL
jgi:hypothetical protein